jgi:hypothetical protein
MFNWQVRILMRRSWKIRLLHHVRRTLVRNAQALGPQVVGNF